MRTSPGDKEQCWQSSSWAHTGGQRLGKLVARTTDEGGVPLDLLRVRDPLGANGTDEGDIVDVTWNYFYVKEAFSGIKLTGCHIDLKDVF
ncbi:hypothetical protein ABEB36_008495 [Hypothenemus hampei]|uniref:Uncharacterized protein n=1 Tax=Hypothenemus hampei TaxID=57062 RepID=A0ABD1EM26_HYPHA